jgi:hypothetical protein
MNRPAIFKHYGVANDLSYTIGLLSSFLRGLSLDQVDHRIQGMDLAAGPLRQETPRGRWPLRATAQPRAGSAAQVSLSAAANRSISTSRNPTRLARPEGGM